MAKLSTKISPFRLSSLLRLEKDPDAALSLFQNPSPNAQITIPYRYSYKSYDLIICKLGRAKKFNSMEQILDQMCQQSRFIPKEAIFCEVINFYGRARMPNSAINVFDRIPKCCKSIRSFNSLINVFFSCGEHKRVLKFCKSLKEFELVPDTGTYNILMKSCGTLNNMFYLFDEMRIKGIDPSIVTFGTLITALCKDTKIDKALELKRDMERINNFKPSICIYTSLIKALCKKGKLEEALRMKNEMAELDSGVYATIIRSLFQAGRRDETVRLLEEMRQRGIKPNVITYNAMIAGFCDIKDFDAAFEAINEMKKNGIIPDVVCYNTIILGFCKEKRWREAVDLFEDMPRRGCKPDVISYKVIFDGLCESKEFDEGKLFVEEMLFKGYLPGEIGLKKFVEGLCANREVEFCVDVLCRLSMSKCYVHGWRIAVASVMKEGEVVMTGELVDHLSLGYAA